MNKLALFLIAFLVLVIFSLNAFAGCSYFKSCDRDSYKTDSKDFSLKSGVCLSGTNIFSSGTVYSDETNEKKNDECISSTTLQEYYLKCGGVGRNDVVVFQLIDCPSGFECLDGACKQKSDSTNPIISCTSHFEKKCVDNSVYWFDSCGNKGSLYKDCGLTSYGSWSENYCSNNGVYRKRTITEPGCSNANCFSKQSTETQLVDKCNSDETCSNGKCTSNCKQKHVKQCYNNSVYWFDSCGNRGELYDACSSSEKCVSGKCVPKTCSDYGLSPCSKYIWQSTIYDPNKGNYCQGNSVLSCVEIKPDLFCLQPVKKCSGGEYCILQKGVAFCKSVNVN